MTLTITDPAAPGQSTTASTTDSGNITVLTDDLVVVHAFQARGNNQPPAGTLTLSIVSGFTVGSWTIIEMVQDNSGTTRRGSWIGYAKVTSGGTGAVRATWTGTDISHSEVHPVFFRGQNLTTPIPQNVVTATGLVGTGVKSISFSISAAASSIVYGHAVHSQTSGTFAAGSGYTIQVAENAAGADNSEWFSQKKLNAGTLFDFDVGLTNTEYGAIAIEVAEAPTGLILTPDAIFDLVLGVEDLGGVVTGVTQADLALDVESVGVAIQVTTQDLELDAPDATLLVIGTITPIAIPDLVLDAAQLPAIKIGAEIADLELDTIEPVGYKLGVTIADLVLNVVSAYVTGGTGAGQSEVELRRYIRMRL